MEPDERSPPAGPLPMIHTGMDASGSARTHSSGSMPSPTSTQGRDDARAMEMLLPSPVRKRDSDASEDNVRKQTIGASRTLPTEYRGNPLLPGFMPAAEASEGTDVGALTLSELEDDLLAAALGDGISPDALATWAETGAAAVVARFVQRSERFRNAFGERHRAHGELGENGIYIHSSSPVDGVFQPGLPEGFVGSGDYSGKLRPESSPHDRQPSRSPRNTPLVSLTLPTEADTDAPSTPAAQPASLAAKLEQALSMRSQVKMNRSRSVSTKGSHSRSSNPLQHSPAGSPAGTPKAGVPAGSFQADCGAVEEAPVEDGEESCAAESVESSDEEEREQARRFTLKQQRGSLFRTNEQASIDTSREAWERYKVVHTFVCLAIVLFALITVPIRLGVGSRLLPSSLAYVEFAVDVVSLAVYGLHFRMPQEIDGVLANNFSEIAPEYLKTLFPLHLLALFPAQVVLWPLGLLQSDYARANRLLLFASLPALLAFAIATIASTWHPTLLRIIKFIITIVVCMTVTTGVFLNVIRHEPDADVAAWWGVQPPYDDGVLLFLQGFQLVVLLFSSRDIHYPVTDVQHIMLLILSLAGIVVNTIVIAGVTQMVISVIEHNSQLENKIEEIMQELNRLRMPKQYIQEVVAYYRSVWNLWKSFEYGDDHDHLRDLPADLLENIDDHVAASTIHAVPLFSGFRPDAPFVTALVKGLRLQVVLPGVAIVTRNDLTTDMYFIKSGEAEVLGPDGSPLARLVEGAYFGEVALLFGVPRSATIVAATLCTVYALSREVFETLIDIHPEAVEPIFNSCKKNMRTREEPAKEDDPTPVKTVSPVTDGSGRKESVPNIASFMQTSTRGSLQGSFAEVAGPDEERPTGALGFLQDRLTGHRNSDVNSTSISLDLAASNESAVRGPLSPAPELNSSKGSRHSSGRDLLASSNRSIGGAGGSTLDPRLFMDAIDAVLASAADDERRGSVCMNMSVSVMPSSRTVGNPTRIRSPRPRCISPLNASVVSTSMNRSTTTTATPSRMKTPRAPPRVVSPLGSEFDAI